LPFEVLLTVVGDQVPLIPLSDVVFKTGTVPALQTAAGNPENTGVVVDAQFEHVFEIGKVTQGYPGADTRVNVTLCPGATPKTSREDNVVLPLTKGPPLIEYV
jgi:hypothetical protein